MRKTKLCKNCKRELPLTEEYFYKNKQLKDGYENACKQCRGSKFGKYKNFQAKKDGYKVCAHCKKELPATSEYYSKDNSSKDGLRYNCLECSRLENNTNYGTEVKKQYYLKNKTEILEQRKTHYINNRYRILEYNKKRYVENRDGILEYQKQYRVINARRISIQRKKKYTDTREIQLARMKWYREENRERLNENSRQWHKDNKDYIKEYNKIYRQTTKSKEMKKASENKRRALKKAVLTNFDVILWKECKDYFKDVNDDLRCAYCSKVMKKATMEHFIPLSKGGPNIKSNILPVCYSCNSSKNNNDFFGWYPKQIFYSKEQELKILEYLGYNNHKQLSIL